jgi:hypothetical protein
MSALRARKAVPLGKLVRVNFTLKSVTEFLRDFLPDGHVEPGRRPWSSISLGPRGFTWNSRRRTARIDLPGPFSYETPKTDRALIGTPETLDREPDLTDEDLLAVPCRYCGALAGVGCHAASGRPVDYFHAGRRDDASQPTPADEGEIPPWGTPPR